MLSQEIKYARSGNLNIAYQIVGEGRDYLIIVPGWVSNLEEIWNLPGLPDFIQAVAAVRKIVLFDKRGTGLSDRVNEEEVPNLAVRMDDLRAIMQKESIDKASVMGVSEGGPMAILFAVTFPEKVESLILIGSYANWLGSSSNPHGIPMADHEKVMARIEDHWAQGFGLKGFAPSWYGNSFYEQIWASFLRKSASPNTARALYRMNLMIDVADVLPQVTQPCLVIHRKDDKIIPVALGSQLAEKIPHARFVPLDGADHFFWIDYDGSLIREITGFLGHPFPSIQSAISIYTIALVSISQGDLQKYLAGSTAEGAVSGLIQQEDYALLIFDSMSLAVRVARELIRLAGEKTTVIVHTGPANRDSQVISGPVVDMLDEAFAKIDQPGIWVSQICRQFLDGPQISWQEVKHLPFRQVSASFNWYQLTGTSRRKRVEAFLHHQDEKLNVSDIDALLNLKDHLDARFLDNPTLKQLSYYSGLNNFKLKYGFKKLFQIPVKSYLKELRLEFSRKLLQDSDLPVQEVARKVGYEHPASFSKAYLKKFNISPQEERKTVSTT
jgi:pimeloyl-ACP methyl ester carboxylesterase/AraC-like DNA-binding protein